jgi:uncharacterized repeat protein (TIGR01451 family)
MVMDDDPSNYIVNPLVFEKYVQVPTPPSDIDQCEVNGDPVALTFDYIPGEIVITGQDAGKATATGTPDTDGESYIVVGGGNLFAGTVLEDNEFTISGSFGSNTVFEIYDDLAAFDAGDNPLQTLEYHTSCSQPIQLGDVIGSVTLVGYEGATGSSSLETGLGEPADAPTGPLVLQGEEVVFNYEVTNAGNVDLTNVAVTDDVLGAITEFVDMGDGDNILSPNETWILTASQIAAVPGQQMNLGTVTANSVEDPNNPEKITATDPGHHFVETLKFFVPDISDDATYTYTESGNPIGSFDLDQIDPDKNTDPRGATSNAVGDKLWVIDKDKFVYVYQPDGTALGAWKAGDIGGEAEGIATHGDDIWIVDRNTKKVFFYDNATSRTSGEFTSDSSFSLNLDDTVDTKNDHPKGITTDGDSLWVVDDDGSTDKVFKYDLFGNLLGSWQIDSANDSPRGITVEPSGASDSIWIVDEGTDQVFRYDDAITLETGSKNADAVFALAADNINPQGIADPPASPTDVFALEDSTTQFAFVGEVYK